MAVYVDDMRASFGRMIMSHMLADTIAELHAMADTIGVRRKWFQGCRKASWPHYDIAMSKRTLAVQAGAQQLTRLELSAAAALATRGPLCRRPRCSLSAMSGLLDQKMNERGAPRREAARIMRGPP